MTFTAFFRASFSATPEGCCNACTASFKADFWKGIGMEGFDILQEVCVYIYKYTYITYLLCICYMYSNYVIKHYATKQKDAASTPPITKDNAHLQVVIKLLAYKGHQFFKVNLSTSTILKRIRFIQESILQSESRLV